VLAAKSSTMAREWPVTASSVVQPTTGWVPLYATAIRSASGPGQFPSNSSSVNERARPSILPLVMRVSTGPSGGSYGVTCVSSGRAT
jgi:hypothetical protein